MIQLQLNENERAILVELLETCISDLRVEITGTDSLDYKEMLKTEKRSLNETSTSSSDRTRDCCNDIRFPCVGSLPRYGFFFQSHRAEM